MLSEVNTTCATRFGPCTPLALYNADPYIPELHSPRWRGSLHCPGPWTSCALHHTATTSTQSVRAAWAGFGPSTILIFPRPAPATRLCRPFFRSYAPLTLPLFPCAMYHLECSDVLALARLGVALASSNVRPGQSPWLWLGLAWLWPGHGFTAHSEYSEIDAIYYSTITSGS